MRNIRLIKTTQVMIFPADDIDFYSINRDSSIKKIQSQFSLQRLQIPGHIPIQVQPQVVFQNGEFKFNNMLYNIEQLVIEERKIMIIILAETEISNAFFQELSILLKSIDNRINIGTYMPLITTYETVCVSSLDLEFGYFLQKIDHNKLHTIIAEKNSHGATVKIIPSSIKFQIRYYDIPAKLKNNKITISDKSLILELREMTDPSDHIFFSASPTDSDTHFKLLELLEEMVRK